MATAESVAAKLKAKGQEIKLVRKVGGSYDNVQGKFSSSADSENIVYGITENYNSVVRAASANNPASLIQSGDKKAIISAIDKNGLAVKPIPTDVLEIAAEKWVVIAVDPLDPQGVALMFTCQIRK